MATGELSKLLGVSDWMIRRLTHLGIIPAKRLPTGKGAHWRYSQADLPRIRAILADAGVIDEPIAAIRESDNVKRKPKQKKGGHQTQSVK